MAKRNHKRRTRNDTRNWIALDSRMGRPAGPHGGDKRQKNRRDRTMARLSNRNYE